ncbi:MAG: P-loop NTPase [Chloroflexi bacterium]|nr:P-loop NTPase [Chloroflexota bacterium]
MRSDLIQESTQDTRHSDSQSATIAPRNLKLLVALREWGDVQQLSAVFAPGNANGIEIVTWCQDGARLLPDALVHEVDAALVSPLLPGFELGDIQKMYHNPKKPIVVIGAVPAQGDWGPKLYQIGVKGHVDLPLGEAQARALVTMIHTAVQDALRERSAPGYIPQISPETAQIIAAHGWEKATVAVWGAKGGVGKSTIAENLTAILGIIANRKTVLLDANMAGGNVHLHFRIREPLWKNNLFSIANRYTVNAMLNARGTNASALAIHARLTASEVQAMLIPFRGNLSVLMGIPKQHLAGELCFQGENGLNFMGDLLDTLKMMADFVVVDLGQDTNAALHLQTLRQVDYIFVVTNPDVASVLSTKEVLDTLRKELQLDPSKFRLIINRFHPEHGIARKDIVDSLEMPELGVLPDGGPKVTASLNRGTPLVLDGPGEMANQMVALAAMLYPPVNQIWAQRRRLMGAEKKKGLIARMLGA